MTVNAKPSVDLQDVALSKADPMKSNLVPDAVKADFMSNVEGSPSVVPGTDQSALADALGVDQDSLVLAPPGMAAPAPPPAPPAPPTQENVGPAPVAPPAPAPAPRPVDQKQVVSVDEADRASDGEELRKAEERYKALQGKYDAESSRSREEGEALRQERDAARQKLEEIEQSRSSEDVRAELNVLSDEEIAARFGVTESEFDAVGREGYIGIAVGTLAFEKERRNALESQVQPVMELLEQTKRDSFYDKVASAHPDYETINDSPEFQKWLSDRPTSQYLLDTARSLYDANTVDDVYSRYKDTHGVMPNRIVPAEEQAWPELAASTGAAPPKPEERRYTPERWSEISDAVVRGDYNAQDAAAWRVELAAAQSEDRIDYG